MRERIILERSDTNPEEIKDFFTAIEEYNKQKKRKRKEKIYDYAFSMRTANIARTIFIVILSLIIAWSAITYIYFLFWVLT